MIIHIPVSAAVKKYFLIRYSDMLTDHNSRYALKLNKKSFLGNFVFSLLSDDLSKWELKPIPKESLVLVLPKNCDRFFIDDQAMKRLSFHLSRLFHEEMCFYVDIAVKFGNISALQAFDTFCRNFGIEEQDYGQDNMYRYYTRYGKLPHIRPIKAVA